MRAYSSFYGVYMVNKINTLLTKINSEDLNNFQNTLISVATYDNNLESVLNTLYHTFFNKKANNNSFNYNLSKIANAKNPLTAKEKYQILSKFAQLFPTRELLLVVAKTAEEILNEQNNQELTINENTDVTDTPQNLTDQKTPVKVDFEGNSATINETDSTTDETDGYTFAERDGLYDVINSKGEVVKSGLSLTAALKTIALTQDEKVEVKDEKSIESTTPSLLEAEPTQEKVKEHETVQEVNNNTGVETEVKNVKEDRADNFSATKFFDMFRKLDENTANTVLEKIREQVSGEAGAEAYNFLLKAKDNGWDFVATYKQTADGQSEQEVENERKEQSKKLARSIEKIIEEDEELSKMLNYKDYQSKKDNKTASLQRKAYLDSGDPHFITDTGEKFNLSINNKYLVNLINESKKVPTTLNPEDEINQYELEYTLANPINWGLSIYGNKFGWESVSVEVPEQNISVDVVVKVYKNTEDLDTDNFDLTLSIPIKDIKVSDFNIKGGGIYLMDLYIDEDGKGYTESFN